MSQMSLNAIQWAIRELRRKRWTLAAIADELGVSRRIVAYWEAGTYLPDDPIAVRLALLRLYDRSPRLRRARK